jgi:hypothetical protein
MAGLLDTIVRKNLADARTEQLDSGALSGIPAPAPKLGDTTQPTPALTSDEAGNAVAGEGTIGARAGVEQTTSMLKNAVAAAAQAVSQPALAQSMREGAAQNDAAAADIMRFSSAPQSIKDVGSIDDAGKYLVSGVARNLPQLGVMAAGGLGARALGAGGAIGEALGVGAPSLALNAGDVYGEGQGNIDKLKAAGQLTPEREAQLRHQVLVNTGIAAPIMAALDTFGFGKIFGTPAAKAGAARVVADSLPSHIRHALLAEGGTEALQEYVGMVANKLALEQPQAFGLSKDDVIRLTDAGVLGAAAGGALGAPGYAVGKFGSLAARGAGALVDAGTDMYAKAAKTMSDETAPDVSAIVPGTEAQPGIGARMGEAARNMMDADVNPAQLKEIGSAALESVYEIPGVKDAVAQGKDFITEVMKSKRLARAELAWAPHEEVLRQGFDQMAQQAGVAADQTGAAFTRYKAAIASSPLTQQIRAARDVAPDRIQQAIAGFNEAAQKTAPLMQSIFNTAQTAAAGVYDGAKSKYDNFKARYASTQDDAPLKPAQAARGADELASHAQTDAGSVKRSVVLSQDAQLLRRGLEELAPGLKDSSAGSRLARAVEHLVNNPKQFDSFVARPEVAQQIAETFNMLPRDFRAAMVMLARGDVAVGGEHIGSPTDTTHDSLAHLGDPNYATDAVLGTQGHVEDKLAEKTRGASAPAEGAQVDAHDASLDVPGTAFDAPAKPSGMDASLPGAKERAAFEKSLATPEQIKKRHVGMRDVLVRRRVLDPDTGAELETTTEPKRINLVNAARAMQNGRADTATMASQQRNDTNLKEAVGSLFNGWREVDEQGRPVQVSVAPASYRRGELAPTTLDKWMAAGHVAGTKTAPRSLKDVEEAGRAQGPNSPYATLSRMFDKVGELEAAGAKESKLRAVRWGMAQNAGRQAVSGLFAARDEIMQSPNPDATDLTAEKTRVFDDQNFFVEHRSSSPRERLEMIADATARYIRDGYVSDAVDKRWAEIEGMPRDNRQAAVDDLEKGRVDFQLDPRVLPAVQLLPTDVLVDARDTMLEELANIREQALHREPNIDQRMAAGGRRRTTGRSLKTSQASTSTMRRRNKSDAQRQALRTCRRRARRTTRRTPVARALLKCRRD